MSEAGESVVEGGGEDRDGEVEALRARLVQAELKAEAIRAGMVDLDGVKLIEASTVKVNEAGELMDGAEVMRALRAAKPWLFGGSSSSVARAPRAEPPRVRDGDGDECGGVAGGSGGIAAASLEEWPASGSDEMEFAGQVVGAAEAVGGGFVLAGVKCGEVQLVACLQVGEEGLGHCEGVAEELRHGAADAAGAVHDGGYGVGRDGQAGCELVRVEAVGLQELLVEDFAGVDEHVLLHFGSYSS